MFNNVGRKIITISKVIFCITSIILILSAIITMVSYQAIYFEPNGIHYLENPSRLNGIIEVYKSNGGVVIRTFIIVPLVTIAILFGTYISTLFFVGFGELIENTKKDE